MTRGSGCPPPLLLSRSILQHVRNVCQARAGLSHLPIVQQPTSRASTSLAPRGMRTIHDSPCVNHLPVGTSFRIDPGYSASRPPDKYGGRRRPATGPPRWGHASVLRTTAIHHRRARRGRPCSVALGLTKRVLMRSVLTRERTAPLCATLACRTRRRRQACGITEPPQALAPGTNERREPSSRRYSGNVRSREPLGLLGGTVPL
jgi:hypothetical protein